MGYASYREDIIRRLEEDLLEPAESLLKDPGFQKYTDLADRLHEFVKRCRSVMFETKSYLELATDPEIDLPKRINELIGENDSLKAELERANRDKQEIVDECNVLQRKHDEKISELNRCNKSLRLELEQKDKLLRDISMTPGEVSILVDILEKKGNRNSA